MQRVGDQPPGRGGLPGRIRNLLKRLITLPSIRLEGLYTQFAVADEADKTYIYKQFEICKRILKDLKEAGISIPIRHVCNSKESKIVEVKTLAPV